MYLCVHVFVCVNVHRCATLCVRCCVLACRSISFMCFGTHFVAFVPMSGSSNAQLVCACVHLLHPCLFFYNVCICFTLACFSTVCASASPLPVSPQRVHLLHPCLFLHNVCKWVVELVADALNFTYKRSHATVFTYLPYARGVMCSRSMRLHLGCGRLAFWLERICFPPHSSCRAHTGEHTFFTIPPPLT